MKNLSQVKLIKSTMQEKLDSTEELLTKSIKDRVLDTIELSKTFVGLQYKIIQLENVLALYDYHGRDVSAIEIELREELEGYIEDITSDHYSTDTRNVMNKAIIRMLRVVLR